MARKMKNIIEITDLSKKFDTPLFDKFNLSIQKNKFTCILGPNGCGKTTLILMIANLLNQDSGEILINGKKNSNITEEIGVIFQEYNRSLFPWLTVKENIRFGLKMKKIDNEDVVRKWIKLMNLNGLENYYPYQLSAGMKQRVAIARTLVAQPSILLIDEPFSSLDYKTRINFYDKFLKILEENKKTVVFSTHNIDEAIYLSDKIILLDGIPIEIIKSIDNKLPRPRNRKMWTNTYFRRLKKEIEKIESITAYLE